MPWHQRSARPPWSPVTTRRAHSTSPRALAWDELLDWAGTRAADEDARWMRVDVWTTNERLQHHYLKQGFTSIGIVVLPPQPLWRAVEIDRPVTPLS